MNHIPMTAQMRRVPGQTPRSGRVTAPAGTLDINPPLPSVRTAFMLRLGFSAPLSVVTALPDYAVSELMAISGDRFLPTAQIVLAMQSAGIWPTTQTAQQQLFATIKTLGAARGNAIVSATTPDATLAAAKSFFCESGFPATEWCTANGDAPPAPADTSCPMPPAQQQALLYQAALDWNAAHPSCPVPVDSMCATPPANMSHDDAVAWNSAHPSCPVTVPPASTGISGTTLLIGAAIVVGAILLLGPSTGTPRSSTSTVRMNPQAAFSVFLHGRKIDTVYFSSNARTSEVRRSLIDHDGYDPAIRVVKAHRRAARRAARRTA